VKFRRRGTAEPGAVLFTALVAITLVGPLSIHLFMPALPHVRQAFETDEATAQLTFSLAMFVMAFSTLAYGSFSDRFGRLPVLVAGLVLFSAGAAIALAAPSIIILIVGRVLQGAGAACGLVLARAVVRDVYGADKLGKMIAYLTTAYVLGPLTAPPIGGFLIDRFGWESILILPASFGAIGIIVAVMVIGETAPATSRGGSRQNLLHGYLRLFGLPVFTLYALMPAFGSAAFFAQGTAAAYLTVEVLGRSTAEFGLWFMLGPAGYMAGNFLSGRLGDRLSGDFLVVFGSCFMIASVAAMVAVTLYFGLTTYGLFIPFALMSLGQGLGMPHAQAAAIAQEPALTGTASGIVVFLQFLFIAIFPQIVSFWSDGTPTPMMIVVSATATLGLASGLGAVLLARRQIANP
jgi:DHA1 family bicyclomycin/chloramphenicol resistance-like MFS transporter